MSGNDDGTDDETASAEDPVGEGVVREESK